MSPADERPTLEAFKPLSPGYLRDPFSVWAEAHRDAPVFFHPELGFWVLTRHADIAAAASDWETFSSHAVDFVSPPAELADVVPANFFVKNAIRALDPPEHTVSRKAGNRSFTRGRVEAMATVVRGFADDLIDGFIVDGHCDLMQDFAYRLSLRVIVHMLGLPEADSPLFVRPNASDHLTFGRGRHFCMGAPIARLEVRQALAALLTRIPTPRVVPARRSNMRPS
jgi:cytochrome P450